MITNDDSLETNHNTDRPAHAFYEYESAQGHALEIVIKDQAWDRIAGANNQDFFRVLAKAGLLALDQTEARYAQNAEPINRAAKSPHRLAVLILDNDQTVQNLNKTYRGKDKPTNILSFPQTQDREEDEQQVHIGDAILAYETVINETNRDKKPQIEHISHLIIHGVLHLLGYDHEHDTAAKQMEKLESELMEQLNYTNPYIIS